MRCVRQKHPVPTGPASPGLGGGSTVRGGSQWGSTRRSVPAVSSGRAGGERAVSLWSSAGHHHLHPWPMFPAEAFRPSPYPCASMS